MKKKAAIMIRQLSSGVHHMHQHKIVHRDLKPENILFGKTYGKEEPVLKIIDFALSRVYDEECPFTTICGSPEHTAPEMLTRYGYGAPVDWWGVGVIMYMLLSGIPPFYDMDNHIPSLYRKIKEAHVEFPRNMGWKTISDDAKDLIKKLLYISPSKRATWTTVAEHRWIDNDITVNLEFAKQELRKQTLRRKLAHSV
eukprot:UN30634